MARSDKSSGESNVAIDRPNCGNVSLMLGRTLHSVYCSFNIFRFSLLSSVARGIKKIFTLKL